MLGRQVLQRLSKPVGHIVPAFIAPHYRVIFLPRDFCTSKKVEEISVEDVAKSINTTLTPEQKLYVDKLKKQIRGGINSPRCK